MNHEKIIKIFTFCMIALSAVCVLSGLLSHEVFHYDAVKTSFGESIELYQKGIYARDSISMASQAIAQDAVTLFLGIPLLIISLVLFWKKQVRGLFLLAGTAGYFLYTYASYAILATFNHLYLLYVLLIIVSFYLLILCIMGLKKIELKEQFTYKFPIKSLGILLFLTGAMLFFMWMGRIVPALWDGSAPEGLEHYSTLGIQTLDLGFVVPACFLGSYQLRKGTQWGYLLSMVLLVKGVTLTAAVSAMTFLMRYNGVELAFMETIMFPVLFLLCVFIMGRTFLSVKSH